jgi:hypothetical protein
MIYCIGNKQNYDEALSKHPGLRKTGRCVEEDGTPYPGGSVWQTREEARANCPEDYDVYGVIADWEKDTAPSEDGPWHDLLSDCLLVYLEKD